MSSTRMISTWKCQKVIWEPMTTATEWMPRAVEKTDRVSSLDVMNCHSRLAIRSGLDIPAQIIIQGHL